MSGIGPGGDKTLFEQGVDDELNALARDRASPGELRNSLWAKAVEATKNTATAGRLRSVAMEIRRKGAQLVRQSTRFVKKA